MSRNGRDLIRSRPLDLKAGSKGSFSKGSKKLSDISVKDTIGDVPGLWIEDYKVRPSLTDILGISKLPDMDEVKDDVREISSELREIERGGSSGSNVEDVKKDIAVILNTLDKIGSKKVQSRSDRNQRELISVSRNLEGMVKRVDRIERRKTKIKRPNPLPDLSKVMEDVDLIDNITPEMIRSNRKDHRRSLKQDQPVHEFRSREGSRDLKRTMRRSIPFLFLLLAVSGYIMVVFRSVLKAPISRLFPISLGSETVFGILFTVLVITTMINFFRRIRINRSLRSESPIWHGRGGEEA